MIKEYHLPVFDGNGCYENPLPYPWDGEVPTNPDPYVIKYGGRYYCYSSDRNGVNASVSENLHQWKYLGYAVSEEDSQEYWAPCVIYDNGTFYMYCSNTGADTDDCHQEFLKLYTSKNPEGPFSYVKTFFQKFSIDAHVVKDVDGEVYLFYSVNDYMGTDECHSGTVILADRLIDYTELAGEERPVVVPSLEEEVYEKNRFGDGRDWHTIEGAFFFRHHRKAYVMYAANAYVRENYFLGYSSADAGKKISGMEWQKYPDNDTYSPFIRRNEKVEGTGHNSVIKGPNLVEDWIMYHGRNQEEELVPGTEQRKMRMDPLLYNGDNLVTNAPSFLAQDCPEGPVYQSFSIEEDAAFKKQGTGGVRRCILDRDISDYVIEADMICSLTHMGGRYGLLLSHTDEENYTELIFHTGQRKLSIACTEHNIARTLASCVLAKDYNHEVLHNIRVERNLTHFEVFLDTVPVLSAEADISYGQVGTVTRYTEAKALFFSVTGHTELYGKTLAHISRLFRSNGMVRLTDDKLTCASDKEITLSELGNTVSCRKAVTAGLKSASSAVRIQVCGEKGEAYLSVYADSRRMYVEEFTGGKFQTIWETENKEILFTIYVKQKNGRTAVFLNGAAVMAHSVTEEPSHLDITLKKADLYSYEMTKY